MLAVVADLSYTQPYLVASNARSTFNTTQIAEKMAGWLEELELISAIRRDITMT